MSDQIGHYRIRQKLGSGGMGDVYLAEDVRLRRMVALKVLPAEVARDAQRRSRFLQEAHAASILSHPNVSTIHEVGEEGESVFIAMEYIDGKTLAQVRESRLPSTSEVIDIALQIADALDEAQARGIVHRDIKSGNIMLTARGHVKVLDFGLAKVSGALPADGEEDTKVRTDAGLVVGTPYFMSPEQALGRPVDHRSDLFSLGIVLYELVTGRLPFSGATTTETIERIAHAEPEAMARFNYGLPQELERIIRKLLEKEPDRRYQSARELVVDLKNLKRDSASGEIARGDAPKPRRSLALTAGAAAVLLAALGAVSYLQKPGAPSSAQGASIDSIAVLPFANAGRDAETEYLSDGISETIINDLSRIGGIRVVPRSTVFRFKGKENDLQAAAEALKVNAIVTGRVLQRGETLTVSAELIDVRSNAQLWGARFERKASDALALQQQISREISARLRPSGSAAGSVRTAGAMTSNPEAYQLYLKGRYHWNRRTGEALQKARGYFEEAAAKDPQFALAYIGMADSEMLMEQYADRPAADAYARAEPIIRKALAIDDQIPEAYASLAFLHGGRYEWKEAEAAYRRAIELNPDYPTARHWYNIHLRQMGRLDEAYAQISRARELDPLSMIIGVNLVEALAMMGREEEALRTAEKYNEIDGDFPQLLSGLAGLYSGAGRHEEAVAAARKGVALSGETAEQIAVLAVALADAGQTGEATAILRRLETRVAQGSGDPYYLALVYTALGDHDRAFAALDRAVSIRSGMVAQVKTERRLRPLRSDPRFPQVLRRIGLPI